MSTDSTVNRLAAAAFFVALWFWLRLVLWLSSRPRWRWLRRISLDPLGLRRAPWRLEDYGRADEREE